MTEKAIKLTSFYAATVCTLSRALVLMGCYAGRGWLLDVLFPSAPMGLIPMEQTLPVLLQARGYATIAIGKTHGGNHPAEDFCVVATTAT